VYSRGAFVFVGAKHLSPVNLEFLSLLDFILQMEGLFFRALRCFAGGVELVQGAG
jgi:hypothetical protein